MKNIKEKYEEDLLNFAYNNLDRFQELYPKDSNIDNYPPKNTKCIFYLENKIRNEEFFILDSTFDELGIDALVVRKWMLWNLFIKLYELK